MGIEILPVYVKESPSHEAVMGAGWVSRTWEKEMVQQGKSEIAELIIAEKDFCPVLRDPKVIYGDREGELLKISQAEEFDFFVEGAHFAWTASDLYKKLHTKFYQRIPFPAILVRNLRKVNQVQLLCLDVNGTHVLTSLFQKIWKNCSVPLLLNYRSEATGKTGNSELREAVEQARGILTGSGCKVSVQEITSPRTEIGSAEVLKDSSLVAIAVERGFKKDSSELQWLSEVTTSSLLAFHWAGNEVLI
ncbi:MAG: hypothetical protein HY912_03850 [Desulfomonile tiedjei]|uniref:Uncharacterized protein n=1 Tax=Desulfomonile tiedjei TaxID=2358 RepID=A0A9D6V0U4_9BACT|nr:hypothetical protein [Desulfomonile tiedjei]